MYEDVKITRKKNIDVSRILRGVADLKREKYSDEELKHEALKYNPEKKCIYCGEKVDTLSDHVHATSKFGISVPGNYQFACRSCNSAKGNKHPVEYLKIRNKNGEKLWIESLEEFEKFIYGSMSFYRKNYPKYYSFFRETEPTDHEKLKILTTVLSEVDDELAKYIFSNRPIVHKLTDIFCETGDRNSNPSDDTKYGYRKNVSGFLEIIEYDSEIIEGIIRKDFDDKKAMKYFRKNLVNVIGVDFCRYQKVSWIFNTFLSQKNPDKKLSKKEISLKNKLCFDDFVLKIFPNDLTLSREHKDCASLLFKKMKTIDCVKMITGKISKADSRKIIESMIEKEESKRKCQRLRSCLNSYCKNN